MSVALPLVDNDRGGTAQFGHLPGTLRSVSSATYNRAREWVPTRPRLTGLLIGVTLLATVSDLVWLLGPYAWALPGLLVLCLLAFVAVAARSRREARASAHLSREHAALRRVATLVAEGALPRQVFAAITSEVAQLLGLDMTILLRFEPARRDWALPPWFGRSRSRPAPRPAASPQRFQARCRPAMRLGSWPAPRHPR